MNYPLMTILPFAWLLAFVFFVERILHYLRMKPDTTYQEILNVLHSSCDHEETIDSLEQELCLQANDHEEAIDSLQQELCLQAIDHEQEMKEILQISANYEHILQELQQKSANYEQMIHDLCMKSANHEQVIASLRLELYHAKMGSNASKDRPAESRYFQRIESILLEKIDSTGIPDKNILGVIRVLEPRIRSTNLYKSLHSLQRKGLIAERSDGVWIRI
jgi:hypothetical protein